MERFSNLQQINVYSLIPNFTFYTRDTIISLLHRSVHEQGQINKYGQIPRLILSRC